MAAPITCMTDTESTGKHEQYCSIEATVTTGFESVAQEEAKEKIGCDVTARRGGIVIHLPISRVTQVLNLGSIDNLRVRLNQETHFDFPDEEVACIKKLRQYVGKVDWLHGLEIWQQFYHFDHPILVPVTVPADLGEPVLTDYASKTRKGKNEPKSKKQCTHKEKKSDGMETKVSMEKDSNDTGGNIEVESSSFKAQKTGEILGNVSIETDPIDFQNSLSCKAGHQMEVDDGNLSLDPSIGNSFPETKKKTNPRDPSKPAYRVTCIRNGEHCFDSMKAAANFGGAIHNLFGWNVDMKNYDIEVVLIIDGHELSVCIALTKESLHKRNLTHFGSTTLRPTIAYNMLRLCKIQKGDIVCDPMCGSGSIPVQAAVSWPEAYHIAGEISKKALPLTVHNVTCLNEKHKQEGKPCVQVETFRWNVYNLPLRSNLVDVFITDLPFGKRTGSKADNWKLYPGALTEMARVTKLKTGRACILTQDRKCIIKTLQILNKYWKQSAMLGINIGGLAAGVYLLRRTGKTMDKEAMESLSKYQIKNITEELPSGAKGENS